MALAADARAVHQARQVLHGALLRSGAGHLIDPASLVLSDIIAEACVHAGTVRLNLWSTETAVRVEVEDGVATMPTQRSHGAPAEPGPGLRLLEAWVDRGGTTANGGGRTVWFEIGEFDADPSQAPTGGASAL